MSYSESSFQSDFARALRAHGWSLGSAALELKICKGTSLPFSAIAPHQYQSLLDAKHSFLYHKISDASAGYKPMDCFILSGSAAYIVILYYQKRMPKKALFIDIDSIVAERDNGTRKSLTMERASDIASYAIDI